MPWFKPCAGFSPICNAVFVQTEHCAITGEPETAIKMVIDNMTRYFLTFAAKLSQKTPLLTID